MMKIYAKRKIEPETVFGNMKANLSFKKFRLRGNDKVKIEFGLMAMAHNIIKMALVIAKNMADDTKGSTQKNRVYAFIFMCIECVDPIWCGLPLRDRKSTRLNSSHANISYAVFCLKKKNTRALSAL